MEEKYTDVIIDNHTKYRLFKDTIEDGELLWHHDERDRTIRIFNGKDWKLQFDNKLPILLKDHIFIPRHTWHRVIKGTGTLKLKINKQSKQK